MNIEIKEIAVERSNSAPYGIATDDKGNVWFTQHKANKISCLDKSGLIREFSIPTPDAQVLCHNNWLRWFIMVY
ncbi:hypothetical protein [uncultured Metabacillus sp.]|uniref:hypothetical protein n=1 Tax=uncultured Metabacillus sp. TaxID=2860135 RepID=UPI0026304F09|nr:hypothetical protein [uncultured Metabacillus sp.]